MTSANSVSTSSSSTTSPTQRRIIFWTGSDSLNSQLRASQLGGSSQNHCFKGSRLVESLSSERSLQRTQLLHTSFLVVTTKASEHEKVPGAFLFIVAPKTAPNSVSVSVPRTELFKVPAFKAQICKFWDRARLLRSSTQEDQPQCFN